MHLEVHFAHNFVLIDDLIVENIHWWTTLVSKIGGISFKVVHWLLEMSHGDVDLADDDLLFCDFVHVPEDHDHPLSL